MATESDIHVKKDKMFDPTFGLNSQTLGIIVAVIAVIITLSKYMLCLLLLTI